MTRLILTGDVNLMGVEDASVPFARVEADFKTADLVFSNLECCLYTPQGGHSTDHEGFFADPTIGGTALTRAGIGVVGMANNVNYGEAAITASIATLDRLASPTPAPALIEPRRGGRRSSPRNGVRFGFLQRSSVYWPTNHEAADNATGIAVIRAHTAYQVPMHKIRPEIPPMNRPGLPPVILTWADPLYLRWLREDIAALRNHADIVVVSCHWGLGKDILGYMTEIAHAAIDAGADVVIGHGPHHFLPVEVYRGKPVFYGLGSFSFHTGHGGRKHGDWIGLMAEIQLDGADVSQAKFRFVRHNDRNETIIAAPADEADAVAEISAASAALGVRFAVEDECLAIDLVGGHAG